MKKKVSLPCQESGRPAVILGMRQPNHSNIELHLVNGGELQLSELPPRAVALDGAVPGLVLGDDADRWSFDHHSGVQRFATDATCTMVHRTIVQGFDWYDRDVYVNDLDGDTILSLWLIRNPEQAQRPQVRSLVRVVAAVDSHGPAGQLELGTEERALADTFFSPKGVYSVLPRDVQQHFSEWPTMLEKAYQLIHDLVEGVLEAAPTPSPTVHVLHRLDLNGLILAIAECAGFGGFGVLYRMGTDVVCLCSKAADESKRYTVGKRSDLVRFPLGPNAVEKSLLGQLNSREAGWGGSSSIGGSPRLEGGVSSRLTVSEVWDVMKSVAHDAKR